MTGSATPLVAPFGGDVPLRSARSGRDGALDPLEAALADRGACIRRDATDHLRSRIPGFDLDSFVCRPALAEMFVGPCEWPDGELDEVWDQIDRMLRHHDVRTQFDTVIGGQTAQSDGIFRDRSVPSAGAQLRVGAAAAALTVSQLTLRLTAIDEQVPALHSLNAALDAVYGARSASNVYVTASATPGTRPHFDHHDVILLQVVGTKGWRVAPPAARPAAGVAGEPALGDPAWEGVLEAGSALALPRGWRHQAVPTGGLSVHVTLALRRPAYSELLVDLARSLGRLDDWSEDLPGSGMHPDATAAQLAERLLRSANATEAVVHSSAQIIAAYRALLPSRAIAPLSRMVAAMQRPLEWSYRWAVPTEPLLVEDPRGGFAVAGWVIRTNRTQAQMLVEAVGSRCWVPPRDADADQIQLLRALIEIEALDPMSVGGPR